MVRFGLACAAMSNRAASSVTDEPVPLSVVPIEPGPFHFSTSLMMLLAVIVGGSGRFMGPVVGTVIIILLPEFLRSSSIEELKFMQKWYLAFFGVAVIALMIWLPGGLLSMKEALQLSQAKRAARQKQIADAAAVAAAKGATA